jgi:hypothetical protein
LAGCGGGSEGKNSRDAPVTSTEAVSKADDLRKARAALLTWADLGEEWDPYDTAKDPVVEAETACLRYDDRNLVLTASDGAAFTAGQPILLTAGKVFGRSSQFVNSSVLVYKTEKQAQIAFNRVVGSLQSKPLWRCLLRAEEVPKGPRMMGLESFYAPAGKFPKLAQQTWRHQYEIRIAKKGGTVWIDLVVMREERCVGLAFFSSVDLPQLTAAISDDFVEKTARIMGESLKL